MKASTRKSFAVLVCCALAALPAAAFPGIRPHLPDASGQYVYYRDHSFDFEAYIGFLHYDEATYAMRFFAPSYPVQNAPARAGSGRAGIPKSIELLFTVNPDVDHTDMTGERFLTSVEGADTEIVNYMHDLVYELSARRRKLPEPVVRAQAESREDFSQFGGMVTMEYSFDVPIFNLARIVSPDGIPVFELVTAGALVSSDDKSFSAFRGFPAPMGDKQRRFSSAQEKGDTEVKYNTQRVTLDSQWTKAADNMFLLGDVAVLVLSDFPASSMAGTTAEILDTFCRIFSLGTQNSYADWGSRKISRTKDELSVEMLYYLPEENAVTRDFKVLAKNRAGGYSVLSLTVFDNAYKSNRAYFDSILSGYSR